MGYMLAPALFCPIMCQSLGLSDMCLDAQKGREGAVNLINTGS